MFGVRLDFMPESNLSPVNLLQLILPIKQQNVTSEKLQAVVA